MNSDWTGANIVNSESDWTGVKMMNSGWTKTNELISKTNELIGQEQR